MGRCSLCGNEMLTSEGCTPHKVLLRDGTVVDEPRHEPESSHVYDNHARCTDCGAEPGGIHHEHCDSSRKPDGSQILIDAMAYWDPDTDLDPRDPESDWSFIVVTIDESMDTGYPEAYRHLRGFDTLENAELFIERDTFWTNEEDVRLEIRALEIKTEEPHPR